MTGSSCLGRTHRGKALAVVAAAALILAVAGALPVAASSHREAPGIAKTPKVDATDFYLFRSYETGRAGYITALANYIPLQDAYGGPNFFELDPTARYQINIENNGAAGDDVVFEFRLIEVFKDLQIPVNGENVAVPLRAIAPIDFSSNSNDVWLYTLDVIRGGARSHVTNVRTGGIFFAKAFDNAGAKTFPEGYANYANNLIYPISVPGCAGQGKVFVGQRKEPFAVNLGEIFDLVNVENPLGPRNGKANVLDDKNVTTFALELPTACLTGSGPVIGGRTTAWLPRNTSLLEDPTVTMPSAWSGDFVQVSRLGMPLVNEIVIGLRDKNRFNASQPEDDGQFALYITNPTLPEILEILFGGAGVRAPNNFPRNDLIATFATGIAGINQLGFGEMLRLNTSTAPTAPASQNNLGALGGDSAGFPNGRRPGDDVVDIELRVAMGALCVAFPGVFCNPADATSGALPFTDQTLQDVSQFDNVFPYLKTPIPASPNDE